MEICFICPPGESLHSRWLISQWLGRVNNSGPAEGSRILQRDWLSQRTSMEEWWQHVLRGASSFLSSALLTMGGLSAELRSWVLTGEDASTQSEQILGFFSPLLRPHLHDSAVQLHLQRPPLSFPQVCFSHFWQLFLQRHLCMWYVHGRCGGRRLVGWPLQSVHSPSDDPGQQRPLWWHLQVVAGKTEGSS